MAPPVTEKKDEVLKSTPYQIFVQTLEEGTYGIMVEGEVPVVTIMYKLETLLHMPVRNRFKSARVLTF